MRASPDAAEGNATLINQLLDEVTALKKQVNFLQAQVIMSTGGITNVPGSSEMNISPTTPNVNKTYLWRAVQVFVGGIKLAALVIDTLTVNTLAKFYNNIQNPINTNWTMIGNLNFIQGPGVLEINAVPGLTASRSHPIVGLTVDNGIITAAVEEPAGASGTKTPPASITVVNGIVTELS